MTDSQGPLDPDAPARRPPRVIPPATVSIRCRRNGPLVVELAPDLIAQGVVLRVTDHEGTPLAFPADDKPGLALCRCGQSRRRPRCDGSHLTSGFQADEHGPDGR